MKKGIIFGIGFAAGVGIGFLANAVIKKINENKQEDDDFEVPELLYFQNQKQEEETPVEEDEPTIEEQAEEIIENSGYTGTNKKYMVERISEEEYEEDDDYFEKPDFFEYFVDTDELTNADGEVLEPQERYIGDIFDKVHFQTNDWDFIYIKNLSLMEKYKVNKQRNITKEDFFEY